MAAEKPSAMDERRAEYARYKDDVKKRGKPFYPYAMFEDTVMSVFVVSVIIGLPALRIRGVQQPRWHGPDGSSGH